MSGFTASEVNEPILNSPFEKPTRYWYIKEGEARRHPTEPEAPARLRFSPEDQNEPWKTDGTAPSALEGISVWLRALVNLVRERVESWKSRAIPASGARLWN